MGLIHSISTKSHTFSSKDFKMALMLTFHQNTEECLMSDHDPWQWGQWSTHKLKTSTQESKPALIPDLFEDLVDKISGIVPNYLINQLWAWFQFEVNYTTVNKLPMIKCSKIKTQGNQYTNSKHNLLLKLKFLQQIFTLTSNC